MRPLRFGLVGREPAATGWSDLARRAEAVGYATLLFPDHLGIAGPLASMAAAAAVTERLRVGTLVLNNDFRHPGVLAQEVATAHLLSGGRVELGLGAGHMQAEYDAIGLPFEEAARRVERLEESASILRGLFAGEAVSHHGRYYRIHDHRLEPRPPQGGSLPLLIGGNGTRLLSTAARCADSVQFTGFLPREGGTKPTLSHFSANGLAERIEVVQQAAGPRFADLELSVLVQMVLVTGDRQAAADQLVAERGWDVTAAELLDCPFLLIGTVREISDQIRGHRERFGISYLTVFDGRSDGFDDVVAALAGT
jgi:probable F420-dependent oxidoreductase